VEGSGSEVGMMLAKLKCFGICTDEEPALVYYARF